MSNAKTTCSEINAYFVGENQMDVWDTPVSRPLMRGSDMGKEDWGILGVSIR